MEGELAGTQREGFPPTYLPLPRRIEYVVPLASLERETTNNDANNISTSIEHPARVTIHHHSANPPWMPLLPPSSEDSFHFTSYLCHNIVSLNVTCNGNFGAVHI